MNSTDVEIKTQHTVTSYLMGIWHVVQWCHPTWCTLIKSAGNRHMYGIDPVVPLGYSVSSVHNSFIYLLLYLCHLYLYDSMYLQCDAVTNA